MKSYVKRFLFLSLVFVSFFAVVVLVGCEDTPEEVPFVDQGEVGTYYSSAIDETTTLKLDQNAFTLTTGTLELKGIYAFDGKNLVITFNGDNSGVTVNYETEKLTFTYKGSTYTLYRDVKYAVTFNTNGGSSVAEQTVQNAQKCAEPTSPTKDGYQFIGWYKDSAYTTLYDFDNEIVTSDTTVYACFLENTDEKDEFTVKFDTGVDGVTVEDKKTFNKTLYSLPTVTAAGKTFVGWWVSEYNDATKLSYQFEERMAIKQDITLYAVYADNAPLVSVSSNKITWDNKGINKQYAVNICLADDPEADPIYSKRVSANYCDFDFSKYPEGGYIVTVQVGDYTGTAYYCNKLLAQVCKISIDGSKITWNKVEDATNYLITIECANQDHNHTLLDLGDVNEYDFSSCLMPATGINFTITASAKGYESSTSKTVNCYRELTKVANLKGNDEAQTVSWDAVDGATSYIVTLTDKDSKVYNYNLESTTLDIREFFGDVTVTVTPVKQGYYGFTETLNYNKTGLLSPTNISLQGYTVKWEAVDGAVSYNVKIGSASYTSKTNELVLTQEECDKITDFRISVQAVASEAKNNSLYSAEAVVNKEGVTQIAYANGIISWNSVAGVTKFAVKVDEGEVTIVSDATQYASTIKAGKHTIYVTTADKDGKYGQFFSYEVTVYALNYNTKGGSEIESNYYVKGDTIKSLPQPTYKGYDFVAWYDKAEGGSLFTADKFDFDKDVTIYATWTGSEYKVSLDYDLIGTGTITSVKVYFNESYNLPVPKSEDPLRAFAGWYSERNGEGIRYTDEFGYSLKNWRDYGEIELFAGYEEIFSFALINNDTEYSVSKGPGIGYVSTITIPTTYNDKPITTIEASAFASCSNLKKIYIPNSIQNIEIGAEGPNGTSSCFKYCSALQGVEMYEVDGVIAEDVKYFTIDGVLIYKNEIRGGYELKYFPYGTKGGVYTIPSMVTIIPTKAFYSCSKLTEILVPATVTTIDESAFYSCSNVTKISFLAADEGVEEVELNVADKAFYSLSNLTTLELPARLASFTAATVTSCSKLENIEITGTYPTAKYASVEGNITTVDKSEILFCPRARTGEYKTPNGVTTIGEQAFNGVKITSLTISKQVTEIKKEAFKACTSLTEIKFEGEADDPRLAIRESAFYGCTYITEISLPANLKVLEKNAFGGCTKLVSANVYAVDAELDFAYASFGSTATVPVFYITDVFISKDTHKFDVAGVFGTSKLANVTVEEGNTNYASVEGVLYDSEITEVLYYPTEREGAYTLPETITKIGANVFASKAITSLTIGKNVTEIGEGAFSSCSNLTSVTFEDGGTSELVIGQNAFKSCTKLTNVVLPNRLTAIDKYTFASCSGLTSITIPDSVKTIGENAFQYCSKLESITLPANLESLYEGAGTLTSDKDVRIRVFESCTKLSEYKIVDTNKYYRTIDGILYKVNYDAQSVETGITLVACPIAKSGIVNIPANTEKIAARAFYNNDGVTEIKFPNGVNGELTIESYAFYYTDTIQKIELPSGLKSLAANVCYWCQGLTEITIPNTVTSIGAMAFYYCTNLEKVTFESGNETNPLVIEDGVSSSGYYYGVFYYCNKLTSIELPERTSSIGKYAFYKMANITSINIPSSVTKIGYDAFYYCTGLKSVTFGNDNSQLRMIDSYAFYYCDLQSLVLPEGVETIGSSAFGYNKNLKTISLPASVTTIGSNAFSSNLALEEITIASGSKLETIDSYAFNGDKLITSFTVPQSVKTIGNYAFQNCKKLSSITFEGGETEQGASLSSIGTYAFRYTAITSFKFPYCGKNETTGKINTITIGTTSTAGVVTANLFEGCNNLSEVYISEAVTSIDNLFVKCAGLKKVIVSEQSENFKVDENKPIILNVNGTAIQFIFGRQTGEFNIPEGVTEIGTYAFSGQTDITKVTFPSTLKSIANNAFYNCLNLETVEFADGCLLETIGEKAFANCRKLKAINLPNYCESVGKYAFLYCQSLESLTIPASLETINDYAFANCTSLTSVTFPSTLKEVKQYAFRGCTSVKEININCAATFGIHIFNGCSSVEKVTFAKTATTTGNYMFKDCISLTDVTLSSAMTGLAQGLFNGCTALETIEIPASVTYLGAYAAKPTGTTSGYVFDGCTALKEVTFLGTKTNLYAYTFRNCTSLKSITLPSAMTIIGNYCFQASGLESITIPKTVTALGTTATAGYVFKDCASLESVDLGAGMKNVYGYAFQNCTSLKSMSFPSTVVILGNYVLDGCTALESVEIKGKLTTVGTYMCSNCPALTSVTMADTNTTLGNYAFYKDTALKSITLPKSLTTIGTYAFSESGLEEIELPSGVKNLGTSATTSHYTFSGCVNLKKATLNANMTTMGLGIFKGCTSLEEVTLPSKLTLLGNQAFSGCTSLKSIVIPNGVKLIGSSTTATAGSVFADCTSLESVTLSNTLTTINGYAFQNCTSLKSITIPTTVTKISDFAFSGSGLESLNIPSGVTSLGRQFIGGCESLTTVTIDAANKTYEIYNNMAIMQKGTTPTIAYVYNASGDITIPEGTTIGKYAFDGVKTITSVTCPESMTSIPTYAFYGLDCKVINLGSKVTDIASYAFAASSIEEITLGDNVTIGTYAFYQSGLKTITFGNGDVKLLSSVFRGSALETINNSENIVNIGSYVFADCANLKSISLSEKLLTMDSYAFQNSGLESIDVPSSIKTLGTISTSSTVSTTSGYVFKGCANLKSVTLHEGLEIINNYAFQESGIESLTIPSTVKLLGTYLCKDAKNLKEVTFLDAKEDASEKLTALSTYSFYGCAALEKVTLSNDLTEFGTYAFYGCEALKTIDLKNVTTYGTFAFAKCSSLNDVIIPEGTESISTDMFIDCTSLSNITLPSTITLINTHAFENCTALKSITLNEGLETIQTSAFSASGLTSIKMPSTVINIFGSAFLGCVDLETVELNEGLETLGSVASTLGTSTPISAVFSGCTKLSKINIPDSLSSMGTETFKDCTSLQSIVIGENCVMVGKACFSGWTAEQTVYVVPSRYAITGSWYESDSYSTDAHFWDDTNANFVYEYQAN